MTMQIIKVVVKGRLLGAVETRNVHYYGGDNPLPDAATVNAIIDTVEAAYTALAANLCDVYTIYGIDGYRKVDDWYEPVASQSMTITGGDSTDMTSFQSAILCVFKTAVKRAVGKKFIAGVPEDKVTDGSLVAGMVTAMGTFVTALMASVNLSGQWWYPGIPTKNFIFAAFVSGAAGTILSTMRRRKPGYGI